MVDDDDSDELIRARDAHRRVVVRRLMERGLSPRVIAAIVPEFEDVIREVVRERDQPGGTGPSAP